MPANKDFALRIEILDECFRNRQRNWTLETLVEEVNEKLNERHGMKTSKRSIQNDIKFLIEEKDAPIAKRKDGSLTYFYYLDKNFSIKNLPIEQEEVELLNDVINMLGQVNEFQILSDVEEVISKLNNTLTTATIKGPSIIQFEKHTIAQGSEYIDTIFTSIKQKAAIRIKYQPFNATEPSESIFHPYLLKEYRNRWFLIGRKDAGDYITNYALDRIKGIKNSIAPYIPNNLFDPQTYFNNLVGVTIPEGEIIQTIEIKVAAKQAPYIRTKPIHYTQEIIKEYKNGDIIIKLWLINNYELRSVLLGFGCDLEVIKPLSLRKDMQETFVKAANCYL